MQKLLYFIVLLVIFLPSQVSADEYGCLRSYEAMTVEIENAGSAAQAGDACRAADGIEMALNWLGTCERECSYDPSRMRKLSALKQQLSQLLVKYVKQCGH